MTATHPPDERCREAARERSFLWAVAWSLVTLGFIAAVLRWGPLDGLMARMIRGCLMGSALWLVGTWLWAGWQSARSGLADFKRGPDWPVRSFVFFHLFPLLWPTVAFAFLVAGLKSKKPKRKQAPPSECRPMSTRKERLGWWIAGLVIAAFTAGMWWVYATHDDGSLDGYVEVSGILESAGKESERGTIFEIRLADDPVRYRAQTGYFQGFIRWKSFLRDVEPGARVRIDVPDHPPRFPWFSDRKIHWLVGLRAGGEDYFVVEAYVADRRDDRRYAFLGALSLTLFSLWFWLIGREYFSRDKGEGRAPVPDPLADL